jgi:hypothetical protein
MREIRNANRNDGQHREDEEDATNPPGTTSLRG